MTRLSLSILLLVLAFPAHASRAGAMFGQGKTQYSVIGGNGYAFGNRYFVLGAGVSYYVLDGLGVGLSLENWSGSGPGITKYSPFVQYVFNQASAVKPYVGAFYRHTSIGGLPSINSAGERAGIYIASAPNAYINLGFVREVYLDCQQSIYRSCSETYPDLGFTFTF